MIYSYVSPIHIIANILKIVGIIGIIALPLARVPGLEMLQTVNSVIVALFFILNIALLLGFCYAFVRAIKYRPHFKFAKKKAPQMRNLRKAYFQDQWKKLHERYIVTPSPDSMRLAIIEADAMVDRALKDFGMPGEHLADRLANFRSDDMKTLDKLWDAHRVRNDIVHRPGAGITVAEGKKALSHYEAFLKELEVL
jgi:hypothetical protein